MSAWESVCARNWPPGAYTLTAGSREENLSRVVRSESSSAVLAVVLNNVEVMEGSSSSMYSVARRKIFCSISSTLEGRAFAHEVLVAAARSAAAMVGRRTKPGEAFSDNCRFVVDAASASAASRQALTR